ncbi:hypothetical protein [Flavobacterium sharifuzzamanii]|uniref:hypothetical protein n=1 Tax=Flavobacterium sharifuzzamanii TaxID=2211133 RepID=UPI000DAE9BA0|nr:hypothetical protein [Flavobacterium sharifuzzamanii]KAF2080739.1 hypothetical protein DMA14_11220 [Flavobacterium sharifuzzamanii]
MDKRILWIDKNYCKWYHYTVPLLISLFYIIVLPYINLGFERLLSIYSKSKQNRKNINRTAELERQKIDAKLIREISDVKAGTSEIDNLKERNDSLVKELNNAVAQTEEDLKRHNSTIEQYQAREKELKDQNKNYVIAELLNNHVEYYVSVDDVLKINEIYNLMTDKGRAHYLEAVKEFENENYDYNENLDNLLRYRDLDLVEFVVDDKTGKRFSKLTNLGKLLSTYIEKGYDLM